MSKVKYATLADITGTGSTIKEARADLDRQIGQALGGDYTPAVLSWRKHTIIIYRDPRFGWVQRRKDYTYDGHSSSGAGDDREETIARAAYSIAQSQWFPADGKDAPSIVWDNCPEHLAQEFESWAEWQLYAIEGRDAHGLTDSTDIHVYACARQHSGYYIGAPRPAVDKALQAQAGSKA